MDAVDAVSEVPRRFRDTNNRFFHKSRALSAKSRERGAGARSPSVVCGPWSVVPFRVFGVFRGLSGAGGCLQLRFLAVYSIPGPDGVSPWIGTRRTTTDYTDSMDFFFLFSSVSSA